MRLLLVIERCSSWIMHSQFHTQFHINDSIVVDSSRIHTIYISFEFLNFTRCFYYINSSIVLRQNCVLIAAEYTPCTHSLCPYNSKSTVLSVFFLFLKYFFIPNIRVRVYFQFKCNFFLVTQLISSSHITTAMNNNSPLLFSHIILQVDGGLTNAEQDLDPKAMKINELRDALEAKGLPTKGNIQFSRLNQ